MRFIKDTLCTGFGTVAAKSAACLLKIDRGIGGGFVNLQDIFRTSIYAIATRRALCQTRQRNPRWENFSGAR